MKNFKVLTVVGTRPELIRLSRVINCLDKHVIHKLIHTGQNFDFELNKIFFKDLSLRKPDYQLKSKGLSSVDSISKILIKVEKILIKEKQGCEEIFISPIFFNKKNKSFLGFIRFNILFDPD